jgi:hypothetical protein
MPIITLSTIVQIVFLTEIEHIRSQKIWADEWVVGFLHRLVAVNLGQVTNYQSFSSIGVNVGEVADRHVGSANDER